MCRHYWIIDSANYGVCRKCGELRQFPLFHEGHWAKDFGRPTRDFTSPWTVLVQDYEGSKDDDD